MMYAIGVDLGGTKTAAGLVSGDGAVLFSATVPTLNRDGGATVLDATAALVSSLTARAEAEGLDVAGVGVGSAGVIDAAQGLVISSTDAILGWAGTALTTGLATRLGLPSSSIRAVNDVHAHALGEAWAGAAAGSESSLLVAFGTGVGGSFVLAGHPILGHRFVGGHVGHFASPYAYDGGIPVPCVCGGSGHVEAIASGPAIREAYVRLGGARSVADARAVFVLAGAGDATACEAVRRGSAAAGQAVGGLANILDPEVVVVSGGLSDAGAAWWGPMECALRAELLPTLSGLPVLPAKLGNTAAMVGAARLVLAPASQPALTSQPARIPQL
ncbi:ROK family protein [Pseudarthrobacter polychromogenes]|uniref:Transcriptional regulator n=1 Tax=Pseudarthrobacter polychromogenes TaxID=1676 RepID=A0ABQ1XVY0_9MICC|nr:ROK family protein [Pseudarthrobacter polychromogenes]GGH04709.1 transcriptional regulator [Pseudarthrobacter polychromogenes]